jgi:transposase
MIERTRFVGLDVHKVNIAVAVAEEGGGQPEDHGQIANDPSAIRKLMSRLGGTGVHLRVAYEAGPTGYALQRQLTAMEIDCIVVAPSLIPKTPGDRVKTDRRDALKLARLHRSGDLTPVWIPDEAHEALRNLVRSRGDAKADELRAKHRLSKFLLRQGERTPVGVRSWSTKYDTWLNRITFAHPADQVVFEDYRVVVRAAVDRVQRLEVALLQCAETSAHVPMIAALQAFRGIRFLTAVTIVAEAGDLRRFTTARQFMSYVGVVPSEYSSGAAQHRGRITKTGNAHLRHVLGEAAHHARYAPALKGAVKQRQEGVPKEIVDLSWRAQQRLHLRYRHLSGRIGRNKAITAVAREFAGFVWALGQMMEAPTAE